MTPQKDEDRLTKIPESLQSLSWIPFDTKWHWYDQDCLLVAVGEMNHCQHKELGWKYHFYVVTFAIDEDYFFIKCHGETWEFDLDDIEYFVPIRATGPCSLDPNDEQLAIEENREQKMIHVRFPATQGAIT